MVGLENPQKASHLLKFARPCFGFLVRFDFDVKSVTHPSQTSGKLTEVLDKRRVCVLSPLLKTSPALQGRDNRGDLSLAYQMDQRMVFIGILLVKGGPAIKLAQFLPGRLHIPNQVLPG